MTIHIATGDLLKCPAEAVVNTVNTEGVMGKGIALQFKRSFPDMFKAYVKACREGRVRLGTMWLWPTAALAGPRLVINFPTKGHWRSRSRIVDIESGLVDLRRVIVEHQISSVAVPPLGCGNGGLDWAVIRPLIARALDGLPDVDVYLFDPAGAPQAGSMTTATARPRMTRGKAALVALLGRYSDRAFEASLIETQKLMYFLQESGEELKLRYVRGPYGPYADNLNHVLKAVEGHFLTGFGDGSRRVAESEPLLVEHDAFAEALAMVTAEPVLAERVDRVLRLTEGFESAYNMELLATVHWVTKEHDEARLDAACAGKLVREWSQRKQSLFAQTDVELAWERLSEQNWLSDAPRGSVAVLS